MRKTLLFAFMFLPLAALAGNTGSSLPYADGDFSCTDSAKADQYVRDFGIDLSSFGGKELCNAQVDTKKLFNDLSLVENAHFEAAGNNNFIRGLVDRNNYFSWLKSETRGMERGNDIPYATAYNSGGYFTMQDGWAKLSTLGRVGTVLHEARHTEGYRHYPCSTGPYAGSSMPGCDTSFSQGGSHAVEMEYYARVVVESKNLHPVYQSMARLMALGRSNFVFNQAPLRKHEALALADAHDAYLYDNGTLIKRELPPGTAEWKLKRTSFGASFVNGLESRALDLYRAGDTGVAVKDDYSYYKMYQMPRPNNPSSVADSEEIDIGNMRYFAAVSNDGKISSYNFPAGEWYAPVNAAGKGTQFVTMAPNGQQGLFLVANDGTITPFDLANRRLGNALPMRWTSDTVSYAKIGGSILVKLMANGQVLSAGNSQSVPDFEGHAFRQMVNVPMYDTFDVAP